jgi:hypothetical protein
MDTFNRRRQGGKQSFQTFLVMTTDSLLTFRQLTFGGEAAIAAIRFDAVTDKSQNLSISNKSSFYTS